MTNAWFHLNSGPGRAAFNMAVDEALLEHAGASGRPVLRFYGWTEPAATFGYSQRFAEVARLTQLRPLIRRTTGGGLVPHDADWTYAVAVPLGHEWFKLKAAASYRQIHEWLRDALSAIGVPTELAASCRRDIPGQCFVGWEQSDLLWSGRKIAGAAQRRTRLGLLIQGSIQPPPIGLSRADWEQAMLEVAHHHHQADWRPFTSGAEWHDRVDDLTLNKFGHANHNEKR